MPQLTDLNVVPYYDDFDQDDLFHRVLFRPGFAVQARELTTLQSILQNQVERHGNHMFEEGTVVIPGQVSYSDKFDTLQLESTFAGETIKPEQFFNSTTPVTITGVTSGVKAKVIGFQAATATTQPILYIYYIQAASDLETGVFSNSENITADADVTHTTTYGSGVASGTTFSSNAAQRGSSVKVERGIYFIRGQFVQCNEQTLALSVNSTTENARVGFTVNEELITPEEDATLTDNATGSSNFAAKGAHRLKITLTLSRLSLDSVDDTKFVQLMRIQNGVITDAVETTRYSVLGDTLARRTFDESGDYTTRPFQFTARENVDTTVKGTDFTGVYSVGATTNDGNTASEDLFAVAVTPGKAYVKGYEIEKIATTFIDVNKARDVQTVNAGVTNLEVGNVLRITNVFGTPDISNISGETTPYSQVGLFTEATSTRGSSSGDQIGVTRARFVEFEQGGITGAGSSSTNNNSVYKLSVFDTQMFTRVTLSDTPSPTLIANHSNGGVQVTGDTSGATGFVFAETTSGTRIRLTQVVGTFQTGEKLKVSDSSETDTILENSANTDLTITEVETHQLREARQLQGGSTTTNFSADILLEPVDDAAVFRGGGFLNEDDPVDRIIFESGTIDALSLPVGLEPQLEPKLQDSEKSISLYKLPKQPIKTLKTETNAGASDSSFNARRQFVATSNASGVVTLSAGTNETFVTFAEKDFTTSIITAGTGSGVAGDLVSASGKVSGTGTQTLTITDNTIFGSGAKVKVLATVTKSAQQPKIKTTQLMKQLKVTTGATDAFGTRPTDKIISFGRADVFRLNAIFDSEDTSTDATAPTLTVSSATGVFERGERITGATSGAKGRLITTASPLQYVVVGGFGATDFTAGETITGVNSGATATIDTNGVTAGSKVITSNFTLDTGQRDTYYDISRLNRKPGSSAPRGRLLIVYDYFEHGAGDFFSVDSYSSVSGQMKYADIPSYVATKIDPDDPEPSGSFQLKNSVDFRPTVSDVAGTSTTITAVDEVTGNSFNHTNRTFTGTGSVVVDTPQPGAAMTNDFEFFLGKIASIFLLPDGEFRLVEGVSAERPQEPKDIENAMKLATVYISPFTAIADGMRIQRYKTQRFTMRDIGRLQDRIENLEFYTALNLLERDAESFEIQDSNGLNRFKSGFIVDNFSGHKIGDVGHKDYKIAIDMEENEARPVCVMRNAELTELLTTDTARRAAGYRKTGDILTLDYTEREIVNQPYATRVENVQTYLISEWVGKITLTPSGDEWFETEQAPAVTINRDGNFDAVISNLRNSGRMGTVWNSWETQWSGVVSTSTETRTETRLVRDFNSRINANMGGVVRGTSDTTFERTTTTSRTDLRRTGVRTSVVEHIEEESLGNRIVSRALIPFVRPRTITVTGECFRPGVRLYGFFDGTAISQFITPSSSNFSNVSSPVEGSALVTNGAGKVEFTFRIPEYRFRGQESVPKFRTGEVEFRLTSSSTNNKSTLPLSAGQETYQAKGVLETEQETIVATRNARVVQTNVNQTTSRNNTTTRDRVIARTVTDLEEDSDPLAQTFITNGAGGAFLTSVELFFAQKDNTLPVWVEIRNTVNGYPGPKLLPFGRKVLEPSDVNVDANTGLSSTVFTFDSLVYIQPGVEYCVVVMTNSLEYKIWISQMGERDVSGSNRFVSTQPHLGSLFKSQNNTTWNAIQSQDMKLKINGANFNQSSTGTITLQNDNVGDEIFDELGTEVYGRRLFENPIVLTNSSAVAKVKHRDHGMYSTSNNVTITGVSSEISTTLNGAITSTATSLTLTSSTNFPSSGTVHLYLKFPNEGGEIVSGTISGTTVSSISRAQGGSTAIAHEDGVRIDLYQINGVPLTEINKTHTAIANIQMDSYTIALSTSATVTGASTDTEIGGINVVASENYRYELSKTVINSMELEGTTLTTSLVTTSATSPSGTETSFTKSTNEIFVPIGENFEHDTSRLVASNINEANEMSSAKSLETKIALATTNTNVSPVIDLDRASTVLIANRLDNIDSSSDVFPTSDFVPSTEPEGDNNSAIYITKAVSLENPATALRVFFSANKVDTSEIKVLFKILRTDDTTSLDELGYTFFNDTGLSDSIPVNSLGRDDLQEYSFSAGIKDDGIGDALDEFISFQIKIVMQGTDAANPPRIKDLRAIALAT